MEVIMYVVIKNVLGPRITNIDLPHVGRYWIPTTSRTYMNLFNSISIINSCLFSM